MDAVCFRLRSSGERTAGCRVRCRLLLGSGHAAGAALRIRSGGRLAGEGRDPIQYVKERVRPSPERAVGRARPVQARPRLVLAWDRACRIPTGGI